MLAEISAGWNSLKAARDIVQGLNAFENAAAINEVKVALQGHILDAQQSLFEAQEAQNTSSQRIRDLEAEIARVKNWDTERQRYELVATGAGSFSYMLKAGVRAGEPAHWLCANCFERGTKAILQGQGRKKEDNNYAIYACPACKATLATHWNRKPAYPDEPKE